MENKLEIQESIVKEYISFFKEPDYSKYSIHFSDMLWGVIINNNYKDKNVCFHVDALEYELIIALESGGYMKTNVYFKGYDYDENLKVAKELSQKVFGLSEQQQNILITKSMFSK